MGILEYFEEAVTELLNSLAELMALVWEDLAPIKNRITRIIESYEGGQKMTIEEIKKTYGDADDLGYVYCDNCPLEDSDCRLLRNGEADGFDNCWAAIAKHLNGEEPAQEETVDPRTQFEKDFAAAIKRIEAGAYTTYDVEKCKTALEFIGAVRELADKLRAERDQYEV